MLYLVGDMRHHLYGLAQVVAPALTVYHSLVYAPRRDRVVARGAYAGEAFIVTKVEVGLHAVVGNITLAMLIGIERAGIDIDIRVKLLYGDFVATRLQQFSY